MVQADPFLDEALASLRWIAWLDRSIPGAVLSAAQ